MFGVLTNTYLYKTTNELIPHGGGAPHGTNLSSLNHSEGL